MNKIPYTKNFPWAFLKVFTLPCITTSLLFFFVWRHNQNTLKAEIKNNEFFDITIKKEDMENAIFNILRNLNYMDFLSIKFLEAKNKSLHYSLFSNFFHSKPSYNSIIITDGEKKWILDKSNFNKIKSEIDFDPSHFDQSSIVISSIKTNKKDTYPFLYFYSRIPLAMDKEQQGWSVLKFDFSSLFDLMKEINVPNLGESVLLDTETEKLFTPSPIKISEDSVFLQNDTSLDNYFPQYKNQLLNTDAHQFHTSSGHFTMEKFHFFPMDHLLDENKARIKINNNNLHISFTPWTLFSYIPEQKFIDYLNKDNDKFLLSYVLTILLVTTISLIYTRIKIRQQVIDMMLEEERQNNIHQEKMVSLGELATSIAHEINNPLSIIIGYCEEIQILAKEPKQEDSFKNDLKEFSEKIMSYAFRMTKIIKSLRNIARGGTGSDPMEMIPLGRIMEDVLGISRPKFYREKIKLEADTPPSDTMIQCRPWEIGQVLVNLLNNACDSLLSSKIENPSVEIKFQTLESWYEVAVIDNGEGIPKEFKEKLFTPFFTTKKFGKGTGVGLRISREIINNHKGRLFLDESSKNTKFCIHLPKQQIPS